MPNRSLVFREDRDFIGNVIDRFTGQVSLDINVKFDVRADDFQAKIDSEIRKKVNEELRKPETLQTLSTLAEHFTDHLMFFATGDPDRIFFNVEVDSSSVVDALPEAVFEATIQEPGIIDDQIVAPVGGTSTNTPAAAPATGNLGLIFNATLSPSSWRKIDHRRAYVGKQILRSHVRLSLPGEGTHHRHRWLARTSGRHDPVPGSLNPQPIHALDTTRVVIDPSHSHVATKRDCGRHHVRFCFELHEEGSSRR